MVDEKGNRFYFIETNPYYTVDEHLSQGIYLEDSFCKMVSLIPKLQKAMETYSAE
jgi:hypothetical protein